MDDPENSYEASSPFFSLALICSSSTADTQVSAACLCAGQVSVQSCLFQTD
jgi:hypothetical protein